MSFSGPEDPSYDDVRNLAKIIVTAIPEEATNCPSDVLLALRMIMASMILSHCDSLSDAHEIWQQVSLSVKNEIDLNFDMVNSIMAKCEGQLQ
jgi:hypothetical protein